jgi:hypothetical protein
MLSSIELNALDVILRQDDRAWPRLELHDGDVVAEVTLPAESKEEAASLVAEATALGFRVDREEKLLLSESAAADALHYIIIAFQYIGGAAGFLVAADKASSVVADRFRKLKMLLSNHSDKTTYAPAAHLSLLRDWLDAKYGQGQWQYDPDALEAKPIAEVVVYQVVEEITGTRHLLVTKGDVIEEFKLGNHT